MKKYFTVTEPKYEYGKIWIKIKEYYLLKEGYIICESYREDPNDLYYDSPEDSDYTTRKDYCEKLDADKVYDSLEEAKKALKEKLDIFYKEECLKLLCEYNIALLENKFNC